MKTLLAALEQVFELEARFHDGQLSVYRSGQSSDVWKAEQRKRFSAAITPAGDAEKNIVWQHDETEKGGSDECEDDDAARDTDAEVDAAVDSFEKKVEKLDEDTAVDAESSEADDDCPTCQYCGDTFDPRGLSRHEQRCNANPDTTADDSEDADEVTCEYCGDSFPERGLGPHQRFCEDDPANADDEPDPDGDTQEESSDSESDAADGTDDDGGGRAAKKPAAIRKAMENPDDLPDEAVPVGVAIQYNAGSYTCKTCGTCVESDQALTDHVNAKGHRGAYQVNRRRCK